MTTILVTGGTGTLGRALLPRLAGAGHTARVLSRRPAPASAEPGTWATGDLRRGHGLAEAVAGAGVVVHCSSAPRGDEAATANLTGACRRAGISHLVYISIVGVDRIPFGYYGAKLRCERLIEESGLGWTVLRATQFHDLILRGCAALARLPVMPVPAGVSFQPVSVTDVAARLAELAGGPPAGRAADLAGPQILSSAALARSYLRASGRRRPLLPVRPPGRAGAAFRRGYHLAPDRADGTGTFEDFLAARFPGGRQARPSAAGGAGERGRR